MSDAILMVSVVVILLVYSLIWNIYLCIRMKKIEKYIHLLTKPASENEHDNI